MALPVLPAAGTAHLAEQSVDLENKSAEPSHDRSANSGHVSLQELPDQLSDRPRERRVNPRFPVDSDSTSLLVSHGHSLQSSILDLSLDGCRLRTRERYAVPARARVEVAFKVNGIAFRFLGVIQWTDSRQCVGIRFVDMIPRRREQLAEVISEIEAVAAAKAAEEAAEREARKAPSFPAASPVPAEELLMRSTKCQGTTSVVPQPSQKSPWPEALYQGMTSVMPQASQKQHRASAPAESFIRANTLFEASSTGQTAQAQELAAWEAREWAEIQQLGQAKAEAAQASELPNQAPTKPDRRAQARHPVDTSAAILLIKIGSRLSGRIMDLSAGGCRILCDERFPVGIYTRVETEFSLEGLPFRLGGVVQAIHDRRTVGIRFLDMSGRKREQVEHLIEEIEEVRAMPPASGEGTIEDLG
jgi:hypothetical protein